jgi:hypothetical protein
VEDLCLALKCIPACFSRVATLLAFIVIGLFSVGSVSARMPQRPTRRGDLKTSLSSLSTLYTQEVERLEKQQQQSKALYQDGLISRVEFENGEKALADARAKVDQVAKEIATANQPVPVITGDLALNMIASDRPWSTGNGRIDSLIRYYGGKYGGRSIFDLLHHVSRVGLYLWRSQPERCAGTNAAHA